MANNLHVRSVKAEDILIPKNRQRKEFKPEDIVSLAGSISQKGMLHPVTVRKGEDNGSYILVAGERRIRALTMLWNFGETVRCGDHQFPEGQVPCIYFGDLDPVDAMEVELEENIRRVDLTWIEKTEATAKLMELRTIRAEREGVAPPTVDEIASEVRGDSPSSRDQTRKEILVSKYLADPEVQKAKSADDAFKILRRREELKRSADLAASVGVTFNTGVHTLRHGDAFEIMAEMPKDSFDVIITDPVYGIDADKFSDSGGIAHGNHFYDDSWTKWNNDMLRFAPESYRLAKPQAHAYVFCDVDNFVLLKNYMLQAGWRVFRTPLIWINPRAARAPWPEHGPQRKYQICLFAIKGNRTVTRVLPDVVTYESDENLNHQAQKPVGLYQDLLARSVRAGDSALDCFGGTGPIIPAAHALKVKATYIELDQSAYGIALARLKDLE